ncbi:MAG: aldo/keto reductase [Planctomycetaceae bacterium]|jgi:aryl-alcohol dehydrogenase-like predicted oxidoreductase|nr:aldo/keto reductase [Planctomycetaceae bacterium]
MEMTRLGKTGLMVSRVSMGCIPIQRISTEAAVTLLRQAYDLGVNFYDTAHVYTDSEAKIGLAFSHGIRQNVIIATKALCTTYERTMEQLEESLRRLKTDYIDIYQWHNPEVISADFPNEHGPYQAMQDAQKAGKIRFIGITNHHVARAKFAMESGAFSTLQFPFSLLSTKEELDLSFLCLDHDMGVIGMKGMCGGLLEDGRLPFLFLNQYPHIVPIWGVEKLSELSQFINLLHNPEPFTPEMQTEVEKLRAEHGDEFCRACGYCLPCPAEIPIPFSMRALTIIKRGAMMGDQFTPNRVAEMQRIDHCIECRDCVSRCPYHLDVPRLLKVQQAGYMKLYHNRQ